MKKILLTADWHFNKDNRLQDFVSSTATIIDYAIKEKVEHFFLLGDIYKTWTPSSIERIEFHKLIRRLKNANIPVSVILGNHDIDDKQPSKYNHCMSEFVGLGIDNVNLYYDKVETVDILGKKVLIIPHLSKVFLQGRSYKDVFVEEAKKHKADLLLTHVLMMDAIDAPMPPSDRSITFADVKDVVTCPMFMGDIHGHKLLREDPVMGYVGSPERITFNEMSEKKGFVVYDLDTQEYEWKETPARRFVQLKIDVDKNVFSIKGAVDIDDNPFDAGDHTDVTVALLKALKKDIIEGSVFKLIVTGHKNTLDRMNRSAVIAQVRECLPSKIAKVSFDYNNSTVQRDVEFSGHLSADEAFKMWLGKQEYDDKLKNSVAVKGLEILSEN